MVPKELRNLTQAGPRAPPRIPSILRRHQVPRILAFPLSGAHILHPSEAEAWTLSRDAHALPFPRQSFVLFFPLRRKKAGQSPNL